MQRLREAIVLVLLAIWSKAASSRPYWWPSKSASAASGYCLSWRMAVEANNIRAWRTVPAQCSGHVEAYMVGGQYERDLSVIVDSICSYIDTIALSDDGLDAWILDVDDTCISNLFYYRTKRYGCEPFDPVGFKAWAVSGRCSAVPDVLRLFVKLIGTGFKVFLVTGRDEETLGQATLRNLETQGFFGYERLILRTGVFKGQSAIAYKSAVRKQLAEEGYRIWGNVGDQWSDLQGEYVGNRTFKLPNPMYFIP
ncbi:HAD superfamily [Perilla frutescens var. frutescens]|nr:HAD superfamily [Perilla frutescens var. frutescens]